MTGMLKQGEQDIAVYNVLGEKHLTLTLSKGEGTTRVNVSALAGGVYFVEVRTENFSVRKKVMKF